jgi:hypothetical protein
MRWVSRHGGFREALSRASLRGATEGRGLPRRFGDHRPRPRAGTRRWPVSPQFDRFDPGRKGFAVSRKEIDAAWARLPGAEKLLELAAERIADFLRQQVTRDTASPSPAPRSDSASSRWPARHLCPGGKAAYPSPC